MQTLKAGNRSILLRLDPKRWPTKLELQTKALAPLPTVSTRESNSATDTIGTSEIRIEGSLLHPWGPLG
jgi:hypothetical protein